MKNPEFVVSVILTVITAFVIAIWVPGEASVKIRLAIGYGTLIMVFLFGFLVLAGIASGKIDISKLLVEKDGSGAASVSRFQLLIFTFVIALTFLSLAVKLEDKFPEVSNGVLALLGISAATYGVSKGIQAQADKNGKDASAKAEPPGGEPPKP